MLYRIEVAYSDEFPDPVAAGILADIRDMGITGIREVRTVQIYLLETDIGEDKVRHIAAITITLMAIAMTI